MLLATPSVESSQFFSVAEVALDIVFPRARGVSSSSFSLANAQAAYAMGAVCMYMYEFAKHPG